MAVGFPAKTSFTDGTTLPASDLNDVTGTLNLIKPTAKGDIFVGSAANTYTKLSVGSDGQTLTASSSAATGVAWGTPSATAYTLIQTINVAGGYSFTFSSIPQTYKSLKIVGSNIRLPAGYNMGASFEWVPNGVVSGNSFFSAYSSASSATATGYGASTYNISSNFPVIQGTALRSTLSGNDYSYNSCYFEIDIPEYTDTDSSATFRRAAFYKAFSTYTTGNPFYGNFYWYRNAALTSMTFQESSAQTTNYSTGSISLYGITG
jgi:hypothetical protein